MMKLEELFEECVFFFDTNIDKEVFFFNIFKKQSSDLLVSLNRLFYFFETFNIDLEDVKRLLMPNMEDSLKKKQVIDLKLFIKVLKYYEIDLKEYFESKNNEENSILKSNPVYFISAFWNNIELSINKK